MRFAINNEPEKVLPVGATFFEPSGVVHTTNGSARTDGPTRALVFMIVPKGAPLTSPAWCQRWARGWMRSACFDPRRYDLSRSRQVFAPRSEQVLLSVSWNFTHRSREPFGFRILHVHRSVTEWACMPALYWQCNCSPSRSQAVDARSIADLHQRSPPISRPRFPREAFVRRRIARRQRV